MRSRSNAPVAVSVMRGVENDYYATRAFEAKAAAEKRKMNGNSRFDRLDYAKYYRACVVLWHSSSGMKPVRISQEMKISLGAVYRIIGGYSYPDARPKDPNTVPNEGRL